MNRQGRKVFYICSADDGENEKDMTREALPRQCPGYTSEKGSI